MPRTTTTILGSDGEPLVRHHAGPGPDAEALRHEARVLELARGPGVVALVEATDDPGGGAVLVTRYVPGGTLAHVARTEGTPGTCAALAEVALALARLHDLGLVHGRCSADHVVGTPGAIVLCGFSQATVAEGGAPLDPAPDVEAFAALVSSTVTSGDELGQRARSIATALTASGAHHLQGTAAELAVLARQATGPGVTGRRVVPPGRRATPPSRARRPRWPLPRRRRAREPSTTGAPAQDPAAHGHPGAGVRPPGDGRPPSEGPPRRRHRPHTGPLRAWLVGTALLVVVVAGAATFVGQGGGGQPPAGPVRPAAGLPGAARPRLVHQGEAYEVGDPGDLVAVGDWDCDGTETPAVVRAGDGSAWTFPRWGPGEEVVGEPLGHVPAPTAVAAVPGGDGCHRLQVTTANGLQLVLDPSHPPAPPG